MARAKDDLDLEEGTTLDGDIRIFDDFDDADESKLREVILEIETFAGQRQSVRVTVLTAEQWAQVQKRYHSRAARRDGVHRTLHILRDPTDPFHLLVSPSAVRGVNDESQVIYAELVYKVLNSFPFNLPDVLKHGLVGTLAEGASRRLRVNLGPRVYARESLLVQGLVYVLVNDYKEQLKYPPLEWARLLARDPDKFFLALRKSTFAGAWLKAVKDHPRIAPLIADASNKRAALIDLIRSVDLKVDDPLIALTQDAINDYLASASDDSKDTTAR